MFNFGTTTTRKTRQDVAEDIFGSADKYKASLEENLQLEIVTNGMTSAPTTQKVHIRAYSKDYYEWIGQRMPSPAKSPKVSVVEQVVASARGKECKACAGTGLYRLHKYNSSIPCAKCAGKGIVTVIDEARTKAYSQRRASGKSMDISHTDYVH